MTIPFNQPYYTGHEAEHMHSAMKSGNIASGGEYSKRCSTWLEQRYGFNKCLLTTSCTDALEWAAILLDIGAGDEVIMPSYTFVSTANAFVLRGAKMVFADSMIENPNIDAGKIEALITNKTKAIVVVHYAGIACDMDRIMQIATKYQLAVVEDAAQAIDGFYKGKPLGSIGHLAAFSFHETKNITCGEGGALAINDSKYIARAENIKNKGTNREAFLRGEVSQYNWVDVGSSFQPSDITAAFLYAQLQQLEAIQSKRKSLWEQYLAALTPLHDSNCIQLPYLPAYASNNAHIFYFTCKSNDERGKLIAYLKDNGICAAFHYISLHQSPYYLRSHPSISLPETERYSDCLVRLPLFYALTPDEVSFITDKVTHFYSSL